MLYTAQHQTSYSDLSFYFSHNAANHQRQKQSDEGAALFAVRVHMIVSFTILNVTFAAGSLAGLHIHRADEDFFLGIPLPMVAN